MLMSTLPNQAERLPVDAEPSVIAETARVLRGMNYSPTLLLEVPGFLEFTKQNLLAELARTRSLPASEINQKQCELLVYHYELLQRLRRNDPEAWDVVNELFEDD